MHESKCGVAFYPTNVQIFINEKKEIFKLLTIHTSLKQSCKSTVLYIVLVSEDINADDDCKKILSGLTESDFHKCAIGWKA